MSDSRYIERLLSTNSSMPSELGLSKLVQSTLKTQYRPDKLFVRDDYMKWDLVYNNIDTPHRLARGAVVAITDRTQLRTELNDLTDFKI